MAKEAERLLDGSGWLPEPLRLAEPGAVEAGDGKRPKPPTFRNSSPMTAEEEAGEADGRTALAAE